MHPHHQPTHHVCEGCRSVVRQAGFSARFACVGIVNVATLQEVVVPIFVALEGGGRMLGLVCARSAETIPGWLLVAVAVTAATSASASSSAVVDQALMLHGGVAVAWGLVDVAWGLLANGHAELLDVRQLALHRGQAGGLVLHRFLGGGVRGAKVQHRLSVHAINALLLTPTMP